MKRVWKWFELVNSLLSVNGFWAFSPGSPGLPWILTLKLGECQGWAWGPVGGSVYVCALFSFKSKAKYNWFLESLPMPFLSLSTNNRELKIFFFDSAVKFYSVLQIKNSRPQRLRFACLYPKTVWQATLSTSLGHSEWWLLYISTWWCPHAFESEHFSLFSPCLISWTANRHVM